MPINLARDLLGVRIDLTEPRDVFLELLSWRAASRRGYVTLVNPHSIVSCGRDPNMLAAVRDSDLALPDGVGITLASRLLGYGRARRIAGPSLMLDLCNWGRSAGLRHFFYGGGEGVADELTRRFKQRFPGLQIAGALCPPFRTLTPEEDESIVQTINAATPDLVWVGLGTAKQEKWMAGHVGAAFDFHTGIVPWAPAWVRRAGLEWAYRLAHEPRRLWRRNLDSPIFLVRVGAQMAVRAVASDHVSS
jgi:N-acetylglucosaminyldiphosphoundecaprenol N-acetyl-beta-D-mannosaminyltransferase